jgi:hypothetical protein
MKSWQVLLILGILAMGVTSGLVYGWLIDPVDYVDTRPDSLRIDYQTDIVLMVSEIYAHDLDLRAAIDRLSLLESQDVSQSVADCLNYAQRMNFSEQDISNLLLLSDAISTGAPKGTETP